MNDINMRTKCAELFKSIQNKICFGLEKEDAKEKFINDSWQRTDQGGSYGGGGDTRVLRNGAVFEQAGVNFSEVHGTLPAEMAHKLTGVNTDCPFYATGVSLVIHPYSPMVPTTHANFRYLEVADKRWFGGGADLTPYYLFEEDAVHFHTVLKSVCEKHDPQYYPKFKKWCDEYFYLPHRQETRGIGGLFFDYLGKDISIEDQNWEKLFNFQHEIGHAFNEAYLPIVSRRKSLFYTDEQKNFQLLRRGRYVEFNLLYDRGTQFGLKTGGRTESILMSLPPNVKWEYNLQLKPGSPEQKLVEILKSPREWL